MRLHPAWPVVDTGAWNLGGDPNYDFEIALTEARGETRVSFKDVRRVKRYYIDSGSGRYEKEGDGVSSELQMYVLGQLKGRRWFALEAGNDYTGWGCQDYSYIYVGPTEKDVVANGLTEDSRGALGYPRVSGLISPQRSEARA